MRLDHFSASVALANPYHSSTVFRVNLYDLPPKTTYYYSVQSMDSSGKSDGVTSPIKTFTTQ